MPTLNFKKILHFPFSSQPKVQAPVFQLASAQAAEAQPSGRKTTVMIQMGHVPRKTGATGTHREQEFNKALGPRIANLLTQAGHTVYLRGADEVIPQTEFFVALHADGSSNPNQRGASAGYPPHEPGQEYAQAWKAAHQAAGYTGGFLPDNYTTNESQYYGYSGSNANKAKYQILAEHGFLTNSKDEEWLFSHLDQCAEAHFHAIQQVLGNTQPLPPSQPPAPTPPPAETPHPSAPPFPGTTRRGSRGPAVQQVQQRLHDRGWNLAVDGIFGPNTETVVRKFQAEKHIGVDGIVGPVTWNTLWTAPIT